MAVKISEKSCKVSFLKARDFWQDCSNRSGTEGILSSVCVCAVPTLLYLYSRLWSDAAAAGVVCRNPMSILRRQWDMPKFLPFALLLEF